MLSEKQLEDISRILTNGNRGHTEKLYLQDMILSTISRESVDELVFKGGTALLKFYQLDTFSEDLDFSLNGEINLEKLVDKIIRDLESYGAEVEERKQEQTENSFKTRLGIKGPLYNGERQSLCFIRIEVNKKSKVENVEIQRYTPKFQDINTYDLPVLSEEEILSEKIRAIRTRDKPRDLYDIYHLLKKGVKIDKNLVQAKLDYYQIEHDSEKTIESAGELEKGWSILEALTYSNPPDFDQALEVLKKHIDP